MGKLPVSHCTLKLTVSPSSTYNVPATVGFTFDGMTSVLKKDNMKEVSTLSAGLSKFWTPTTTLYGKSYLNLPERKYDFSALKVNKPSSLFIFRPTGEFSRNQ